MQRITELDLPYLPVDEARFAANPTPFLEAARQQHPWLAASPIGYFVHDYTAIRELLIQDNHLRTSFDGIVAMMGAEDTAWGRFTENQMIAHSAASHKRLRDLFAPRFTPRQADSHRTLMRSVINELLDEWAPRGNFDFEEFASWFPISVMMTLVGAPRDEIPRLRSSLETLGLGFSMDPTIVPQLQEAIGELDDFVQRLMAERRSNPLPVGGTDLLQVMMTASSEGNLTDRELADLLIFLFVAGYDTSKNVLTYTMHLMIDNPDIYERCAGDRDYCRKTVEESLRLFSPATTFRMTVQDLVYRGVLLPRDTMLFFPLSIAGRDPGAFDEPDRFDPERVANRRHVAFGLGAHMCLGQYIARAQLQESLQLIARRIRNPRRTAPPGWRPFPGTWGIRGLPITFTPG